MAPFQFVAIPLHSITQDHESFIFSSVKEKKGVKSGAWKRMTRGPMEDKGVVQLN